MDGPGAGEFMARLGMVPNKLEFRHISRHFAHEMGEQGRSLTVQRGWGVYSP